MGCDGNVRVFSRISHWQFFNPFLFYRIHTHQIIGCRQMSAVFLQVNKNESPLQGRRGLSHIINLYNVC